MMSPVRGLLLLSIAGLTGVIGVMLVAQEQPLVRVNTQLVEVDVVVKGKSGPIANLTQDDFTILDQGKRQKIAAFAVRTRQSELLAPPSGLLPSKPGAVSNRANGTSTTVFLFDSLNTADQTLGVPSSPQAAMRLAALKYLKAAQKGDQYAVYTLAKSIRVVEGFTDDVPRVTQAVERLRAEHSPDQGADDFGDEILAQMLDLHDATANAMQKNAIKEMEDAALKNRALITAQALESIARHLQGIPGRKKLVWLSSSFPAVRTEQRTHNGMLTIEHQEFGREIDHAVRALNDANVAIYPIDPRDPYNAGLGAEGIDTMNILAEGTGGKAFYNLGDIANAIQAAVEDSEITYALGFYPQNVKLDGSYHKLSVEVAKNGVEVRARKGYYASESKPPGEKERKKSIDEILDNPLDATGIGLTALAEAVNGKPGVYDLTLTFDLSGIHMERQGDRWVASMDFITYFPAAKKPNGDQQVLKISLSEQRLRESLTKGYTLHRAWDAPAVHKGDLRLVVQDRATGAAGSVRLHIAGRADSEPR
jgi:VWFA-related protein